MCVVFGGCWGRRGDGIPYYVVGALVSEADEGGAAPDLDAIAGCPGHVVFAVGLGHEGVGCWSVCDGGEGVIVAIHDGLDLLLAWKRHVLRMDEGTRGLGGGLEGDLVVE